MNADDSAPLGVLLVHDTDASLRRALHTLARFDLLAGGGVEFRLVAMQVDQIAVPAVQGLVDERVFDADLVVLSIGSAAVLPDSFMDWLLACVRCWGTRERLLVALLRDRLWQTEVMQSPRLRLVQRVAAEAGMTLLLPSADSGDLSVQMDNHVSSTGLAMCTSTAV